MKTKAASLLLALVLGMGLVPNVMAVSHSDGVWSQWVTKWYTANPLECKKARRLAKKFIGPIAFYNHGCMYPVSSRYQLVPNYDWTEDGSVWTTHWVQLDNTSPIWSGAWGMRMETLVRWNGTVAQYDEPSRWCRTWDFIIHVAVLECKVWNNNTSDMLVRMAYQAGFTVSGVGVSSQRGALQHVFGVGQLGGVQKWP